jgi:hypothetical protein
VVSETYVPITTSDITPGRILSVDTTLLRERGDSDTNAILGPEGDRAVTGTHPFLIVAVDAARGQCTAVPLFTKTAVGNQPLDDAKKSGMPDGWKGTDWFFSRWQHWRVPLEALVAAAPDDAWNAAPPRRYGIGDTSTLNEVRNWETRNRASYRRAL